MSENLNLEQFSSPPNFSVQYHVWECYHSYRLSIMAEQIVRKVVNVPAFCKNIEERCMKEFGNTTPYAVKSVLNEIGAKLYEKRNA